MMMHLKRLKRRAAATAFSVGLIGLFAEMPYVAAATGDVQDFSIHQHGQTPRALGMGNAFVGVADDFGAMFYNPAGLARLPEGQTNLELIHAGLDTKFPGFFSDIDRVSKTNNISEMVQLLESNYGNHFSARVGALNAYLVRPRWGLALLPVDLTLELRVAQSVGPQLQVVAHQDTTLAYARGWNIAVDGGKLSMGATAKAIYRGYFNKSISAIELAFDSNILKAEDAAEGMTVDGDLGLLYTPQIPSSGFFSFLKYAKPTFGATVRNIADYGFTSNFHVIDKYSREPNRLERRFDVGSMYELPDWWLWRSRLMLDIRDMGHTNFTLRKGLHMGAEFLWKVKSWFQGGWRVGVNQGYFTAGFNGDFAMFRLDLVTYAQEVGTTDTPKATRIYMAKMSLDF
jgi:hypothetical protein